MLILQMNACRLLMLHHALRETRTAHERDTPLLPWYTAQIKGHQVSLLWGRMALVSAETVLSTFLAPLDLTLLGTAPDNLYAMVSFAATWIFVSNFSLLQLGLSKLGGASERLQSMTIERLNQIAHSPDHAAARCGHVLGALMKAWERRNPPGSTTVGTWSMLDVPYASFASQPIPNPGGEGYLKPQSYQDLASGVPASNPDLFMDDAFWASFLENLDSDTSRLPQTST
jgi:hypothetical protein